MTDIPALVARLKPLAEAATPGPWAWESIAEKSNEFAVGQAWDADGKPIAGRIPEGEWVEESIIRGELVGTNESGHARFADAAYIAACSPDDILALCRSVEEAQEARRLLNPTSEHETLVGAIRNLQQAHLSEQGNAEQAEARVKELEKLAYLGDHHFPDLTYKARLEEVVADLRQAEARATALETRLAEHKAVIDELHIAIQQEQDSRTALQQALDEAQRQLAELKRGLVNNNTDFQLAFLDAYLDQFKILRAERDAAREALRQVDRTLRVPAAEYVPAIPAAFDIIDAALGQPAEP